MGDSVLACFGAPFAHHSMTKRSVEMFVFLFTDIEGSTRLWEKHTGVMTGVIARHDQILRELVEGHGGQITKHTGDGITAAFPGGEPLTCALETQVRFAAQAWGEIGELPIRVGLHAGDAEYHASAGTPQGDYFGPPVNATARVMSAAWGGQILLTPEVTEASPLPEQATLLDLGQHLLKNVSAPQQLYQLLHPHLPRQEFPPPRTLSGQSIRQAVDERGGQMAGLEPQAMGIALVAATLLPALQGELDSEAGALEGNLGVLDDLGATSLRGFVAGFAERLRAGGHLPAHEIQSLLQRDLQAQWQAGGETATVLRADASRLLQAVHGVEAAMAAATVEVKEALARGLADLGTQFGEFRWMLTGVQDTLAEMRTRQALQLALQREQLDLQRQQLVKTNLILQRQQEGAPMAVTAIGLEVEDLPPADLPCPYKGLAAYEAQDAEYFFGREELVAELTARLAGTRFLAVVGPSGSGKSSVVRAGLLPAIWADALPGSKDWQTLVLTPGAHPLEELALRVSLLQGIAPSSLLTALKSDPQALDLAVKQALVDEPDDVQLLLVVDQFEEVFALCRDEAERRRFIDALVCAVEADEGRTVIVLTIRADFYGRCADYPVLATKLQDSLLVGPLGVEELRQAIERPAERVGLRLEPGLADLIMGDVADEPGALPLMSHALMETWGRRRGRMLTLSGYTESGGVAGAIAQTADTVYQGLPPEQQAIVRSIFLRLTELGEEGTQDTRRRVSPRELVLTPEEGQAVEEVLATLANARLVTTGEETVEVAHEALIREWPALRGWLEEDREGLRIHRHLTEAAGEWERLGREPGELYRGARLAAAVEWAEAHDAALNPLEREFLAASQELALREEAEREAQRQRELEAARALAAEQEKRADVEQRRAEEQALAAGRLRRRALLLAGAMAIAIILAVAAVFAFQQASQNARAAQAEAHSRATAQAEADAAASEASQQRDAAQASERQALEAYSLSLVANARQVQEDEDMELALLLALAANGIEDPPEEAQRALLDITYEPATRRVFVAEDGNIELDVSPDGQTMAVGSWGNSVHLWDLASGELLNRLEGHEWPVRDVAFSPDGRRLLSGSMDGTAILWDVASGEIIHRLAGHTAEVWTVAFGPDGRTALTGANSWQTPGELILWDLETDDDDRRVIRRFGAGEDEHRTGVRSLAISPDGRTALVGLGASSAEDRPLVLWDLETFEVVRFLEGPATEVSEVAISADGRFGLSGTYGEMLVSLWDLETGEELLSLEGHETGVLGVAFSPDGRTALSSDGDGVLIYWDLDTGEPIRRLLGHTEAVFDVLFLDDTRAISSSGDGTVRLWDLTSTWLLDRWGDAGYRHGDTITALAIRPDGRLALSGAGKDNWADAVGKDNSLILWDYQTGEPLRRLEGHQNTVNDVAFSPDGHQALSASDDATLILWDLDTGEMIRQLVGHTNRVTGVDISSDGSHALSSGWDGTVIHWRLPSGEVVQRLVGHQFLEVGDVAFGVNDELAISYAKQDALIVWDLESGQQVRRLTGVGQAGMSVENLSIMGMGLSPDGGTVLSVGGDGVIVLWDVKSGQSIQTFEGHASWVQHVMFSPDGRTALTGGWDDNLILWDVATARPLRRLPVSASYAGYDADLYGTRVAIHPDGQTALSGEPDGTILKWQLAEPSPAELIAWIGENRPLRELTCLERETYQIAPFCDEAGNSTATSADLLAAAAQAEASSPPEPSPPATPPPTVTPAASPPPQATRMAVLGENRGELTRDGFDAWTYEGQAGELLSLHLQADTPLTGWMEFEEREAAGVLDSVLLVVAPDGRLLALADDTPSQQDWESGDSLIEAVYLPVDGVYRIEAHSMWDDIPGGYTLTIESRKVEVDPAVLQGYVGTYHSSWGVHTLSVEDGRLYWYTGVERLVLDPISETEFILNPRGYRLVFSRGDDGLVTGFDVITWDTRVEAVRLEE
jgi:WD40 repeat protein/class 3 adenylate cyclase